MLRKQMLADFKNLGYQVIYFIHNSGSYFNETFFENEKLTLQTSMKVLKINKI